MKAFRSCLRSGDIAGQVEFCGDRAPRMQSQGTSGVYFFLMVSTTCVDLRCVATLTVVKRPVDALRPILKVFDFIF